MVSTLFKILYTQYLPFIYSIYKAIPLLLRLEPFYAYNLAENRHTDWQSKAIFEGRGTLQGVQTQYRPNPEPLRDYNEPIFVFLRVWLT